MSIDFVIPMLAANIRNLFTTATYRGRNGDKIRIQTIKGHVLEKKEQQSYGFCAKARRGDLCVLRLSGNPTASVLLPICSTEGAPELEEGDAAIWSEGGATGIARDSGVFEINGTAYSGLVKADELKTQLDKLSARVDRIIAAIKAAEVGSMDGGKILQLSIVTALNLIVDKENFSNIKNDTVVHGDGQA